jgi:hypothetical protein
VNTGDAKLETDMNDFLQKRLDGVYEESLGGSSRAEYSEAADTGLWIAVIYRHDVSEWHSHGYATLDEARQAAREHYDHL